LYDDEYFTSRNDYFFQNPIYNPDVTAESASMESFRHGLDIIKRYQPRGNLLDVGCAVGVFLALARDAGFETHGNDISRYAADRCAAMGHDARCGELESVGFDDASFDVVTLWDVIEHFPDPSRQLQQIYRILKPNGILLLDTPNEAGLLRALAQWLSRATFGRFDYPVRKLYHEFHLYYFTEKTLKALLNKNSFELVLLQRNCIPLVKARGSWLERQVVRALSIPERLLHREFELLAVAKKRPT